MGHRWGGQKRHGPVWALVLHPGRSRMEGSRWGHRSGKQKRHEPVWALVLHLGRGRMEGNRWGTAGAGRKGTGPYGHSYCTRNNAGWRKVRGAPLGGQKRHGARMRAILKSQARTPYAWPHIWGMISFSKKGFPLKKRIYFKKK